MGFPNKVHVTSLVSPPPGGGDRRDPRATPHGTDAGGDWDPLNSCAQRVSHTPQCVPQPFECVLNPLGQPMSLPHPQRVPIIPPQCPPTPSGQPVSLSPPSVSPCPTVPSLQPRSVQLETGVGPGMGGWDWERGGWDWQRGGGGETRNGVGGRGVPPTQGGLLGEILFFPLSPPCSSGSLGRGVAATALLRCRNYFPA